MSCWRAIEKNWLPGQFWEYTLSDTESAQGNFYSSLTRLDRPGSCKIVKDTPSD